jgi:signal transduction histidine kinase
MARVRVRASVFRWLAGLLAGAALVAGISAVVELLDEHVPVPSLLVLYLLAVLPVALVWGPGFAVLVALVSTAVFIALFLAPLHPGIADAATLFPLAVFLVTAGVVGELAARLRRRAQESGRLTDEQAALRRVAMLVARATPPGEIFDAVIREVAQISRADLARLERYEDDGTVTGVAVWSRVPVQLAVGTRFSLEGPSIAGLVQETCRPARVDSFAGSTGPLAAEAQQLGIRSSVGCPIVVAGRLWGVIAASTKSDRPFPPKTEAQIADFTELVATAIANTQSRAEVTELLEDQAALRRIATLVACDAPAEEVVSVVGAEVARVLGAAVTTIVRLDADGLVTVVCRAGPNKDRVAEGTRWRLEPPIAIATALATGEPAGLDEYSGVGGPFVEEFRSMGVRAALASPIVVSGRSWGALAAGTRERRFPAGTEQRLVAFTELVAIAVANSENATRLAASRARVVTASDEARRRIERDLHDGAQQRLVALGLELRLAQESVPPDLPELRSGIGRIADELGEVLDELREMSRGIHPAVLTEGGLGPALRALARRLAIMVEFDIRAQARFPEPIEIAAYYAAAEALTNTVKHADASYVTVLLEERLGCLCLSVQDDGSGGADPAGGSGIVGIRDRVEALGGSFEVTSRDGEGTLIEVALPLRPDRRATDPVVPTEPVVSGVPGMSPPPGPDGGRRRSPGGPAS